MRTQDIKLSKITTTNQVRQSMDAEALQELADDIQAHGVLQPILVQPIAGGKFQVIAGHRRFFASEKAGLKAIPAIVQPVADAYSALELQIAENLQREDLNEAEISDLVAKLYAHHQSLDTVALALNKSKAWVSKHLKFAEKLHWQVRKLFEEGVSEDLELLLMLSDVYWISQKRGDALAELVRANDEKPFDTPIRTIAQESLRTAKAEQKTAMEASQDSARRSVSKPKKARNARQLCTALLYAGKKPSAEFAKWPIQERTTLLSTMQEHYRAGQNIQRTALAIAKATQAIREEPFLLSWAVGLLNPERQEPMIEADALAMLDDWWGEKEAK